MFVYVCVVMLLNFKIYKMCVVKNLRVCAEILVVWHLMGLIRVYPSLVSALCRARACMRSSGVDVNIYVVICFLRSYEFFILYILFWFGSWFMITVCCSTVQKADSYDVNSIKYAFERRNREHILNRLVGYVGLNAFVCFRMYSCSYEGSLESMLLWWLS